MCVIWEREEEWKMGKSVLFSVVSVPFASTAHYI